MRTWRHWLGLALAVVAVSLPVSCILTLWLNQRSDRIIQQWPQPESMHYDNLDPYSLAVVEGEIDLLAYGGPTRRYYLVVAPASAMPTNGYSVAYTFHPKNADLETFIRVSDVKWRSTGVEFNSGGNRLFIAKENFLRGS
jgi:hypothetical protein